MPDKKEKSCWYNQTELPQQMLDGASGKLWPPLEESDHFPTLAYLIETCKLNHKCHTILDVGCGAAALSEQLEQLRYTGCDLDHIIDNVATVRNPGKDYIKFDINQKDLSFISGHDIIVMNAFIDVLEEPLIAFDKILSNASKFVICHRQKLGPKTKVEKVKSYSGFSWSTTLGSDDLKSVLKKNNFSTIISWPAIGEYHSFLLVKNEVR